MPWPELSQALHDRQADNLWRSRDTWQRESATEVSHNGEHYKVFCSNDYLGIANHPRLVEALGDSAQRSGVGSTASHLVNGHSREHTALEQELAAFTSRDRVLLFSTGYMANLAVLSTLMNKDDAVFHDRLNHASLLDGGRLSGARCQRYQHCNVGDLQRRLRRSLARRRLIVTDGVFSMDGDIAPLGDIFATAQQHAAVVMVDDAHGLGVLGNNGGGAVSVEGLGQAEIPVLVGTLGKAFGTFGAFVAGSDELIETLLQFARPYIYTTALPPALAAASREALRIVQDEAWRQQHLRSLVQFFQASCKRLSVPLLPSATPIQPIPLGDSARALQVSSQLRKRGILVTAIRPPTVPKGTARLRVTLSAEHCEQDIQQLVDATAEALRMSE